ncbi:MAG: hypothetical protein ACYCSS_14925, partial [Sulfuriferula sp.]
SAHLKDFCAAHYPDAKNDLANVFLERNLELALDGEGVVQIVMPQNWLFLGSYKKQRESLLKRVEWNLLVRLGEGAFDSSQAAGAFIVLLTLTHTPAGGRGLLRGVDASAPKVAQEKAALLREGELVAVSQKGQLGNPDARITLEASAGGALLETLAAGLQGVSTSDNPRFRIMFWELSTISNGWRWFQSGVNTTQEFGGCESVVWLKKLIETYEEAQSSLSAESEFKENRAASNESGVYLRGQAAWAKKGVAVRQMRGLAATLTHATPFDTNTAVVLPEKIEHLPAIWCFCSSPEYNE